MNKNTHLSTTDATKLVRELVQACEFCWPEELSNWLLENDLLTGDLKHACEFGRVVRVDRESTRKGFYVYVLNAVTPNSRPKTLELHLILDGKGIVTILEVQFVRR